MRGWAGEQQQKNGVLKGAGNGSDLPDITKKRQKKEYTNVIVAVDCSTKRLY